MKLKVLLVEDDLIVQRVHQLMLTKLRCYVEIAPTGTIALEKIKQSVNYDIIFVDIGLPDISGFVLIKLLRKIINNIPIIALTGYAGQEEKQACFDAGASDVKYKPIVNNTLREILEKYRQ